MSGKVRPEEVVQATLSSLPDEVVDTVGVTALPSEDTVSERRRKLEFLAMQEEMIKVFVLFCFWGGWGVILIITITIIRKFLGEEALPVGLSQFSISLHPWISAYN